jgi:hypothetical protein
MLPPPPPPTLVCMCMCAYVCMCVCVCCVCVCVCVCVSGGGDLALSWGGQGLQGIGGDARAAPHRHPNAPWPAPLHYIRLRMEECGGGIAGRGDGARASRRHPHQPPASQPSCSSTSSSCPWTRFHSRRQESRRRVGQSAGIELTRVGPCAEGTGFARPKVAAAAVASSSSAAACKPSAT